MNLIVNGIVIKLRGEYYIYPDDALFIFMVMVEASTKEK